MYWYIKATLFLVNLYSCVAIATIHFKTLPSPLKIPVSYLQSVSAPAPAPSSGPAFCLYSLVFLEISNKWGHRRCGFLCPSSFPLHNIFEVHLRCCTYQYSCSFSLPSSTFHCRSVYQLMDIRIVSKFGLLWIVLLPGLFLAWRFRLYVGLCVMTKV